MINPELLKTLRGFADEDMILAEQNGDISICQTQKGTVTLAFSPSDKDCFTVFTTDYNPATDEIETTVHAKDNRVGMRDYIATNLYVVVED